MHSERSQLRTVAIILAGGTGQRMGLETPKQLLRIAGKPILEHTVDVFDRSDAIDEIIVVMADGYLQDARLICNNYPKVSRIVRGGPTRNATARAGLDVLGPDECKVLLHDAVRPLVSSEILEQCVSALDQADAVDVVIPSADTIVSVTDDRLNAIPNRESLRRGQTPQGFLLSVLRAAYDRAAAEDDLTNTDDCTLIMRYSPDTEIVTVPGSEENIKITRPLDAYLADKLFQLSSAPVSEDRRVPGSAFAGRTVVVLGGGSGIGAAICALAREHGAQVFSYSRSTTNTDVTDIGQIREALEHAHEASGRVDYVVNTAGLLTRGTIADASMDEILEATQVNYIAPILIAQAALAYLRETRGQLLLFTSSSYTRGRTGYALYSSAKSAVVNLCQALADEWSDFGVRVNCINPERTGTPMRRRAFGYEDESKMLTADEVAEMSLIALSSVASGQVFDVRKSG